MAAVEAFCQIKWAGKRAAGFWRRQQRMVDKVRIFVWRHNRRLHSWSMFDEPNINQAMYTDAVAVVVAESAEQARQLLARQGGWVAEELKRLPPQEWPVEKPGVVFTDVRG